LRIKLGCVPCYVNQAMEAADYADMEEDDRWDTVQSVCKELAEIDRSQPSARVGQKVHKIVRDHADTDDPYGEQKRKSNSGARQYLDEFRGLVKKSDEPLLRAARLATAGNAVDFGPSREFDIETDLRRGYEEEFRINDWAGFRSTLEGATELLYFTDNSGEIIYDELFIDILLERTGLRKLDLVVKDGPFLNDVTEEDVKNLEVADRDRVGIRTVDNGDDGESPSLWSNEVEGWLEEYDLVISKGQANYEGLSEYDRENLYFFLTVKCDLVASDVGAEEGSKVLINSTNCS
jgi:uncharacterized protein with ATP-grasp and redox domains